MAFTVNLLVYIALASLAAIVIYAETLVGSSLINRKFTFTDANRVFIDTNHRLPSGRLRGFSMYIRPDGSTNRDHYARFCIWKRVADMKYRLTYQTAARLPKRQGVYTIRINDNVTLVQDDMFGVTFEQETGTVTHEVNVDGLLMFSGTLRNLPNNNDVVEIIQKNYFHEMSLAALVDVGGAPAPAPVQTTTTTTSTTTTTTTTRPPPVVITGEAGIAGMTGWTGPQGPRGPPGSQGQTPTDTDECQGGCQHKCVNTFMSYYCLCNDGYQLESNGRNCRNINECAFNNGGCEHTCRDTDGSVECTCKSGYRRSANRRSCEDDNECSRNPCLGRTCINTIGGFQCVELKLLNDGTSNLRFDGSIVSSTNEEPVPEPFIDIDEADGKVSTNVGTVVWLSLLTVLVITMVAASFYVYRKSQRNGSDQIELHETSSEEHVENGSSETRLATASS